jgi:hypothetical protein
LKNTELIRVGGINPTSRAIDTPRAVHSANDTASDPNVGSSSGECAAEV